VTDFSAGRPAATVLVNKHGIYLLIYSVSVTCFETWRLFMLYFSVAFPYFFFLQHVSLFHESGETFHLQLSFF